MSDSIYRGDIVQTAEGRGIINPARFPQQQTGNLPERDKILIDKILLIDRILVFQQIFFHRLFPALPEPDLLRLPLVEFSENIVCRMFAPGVMEEAEAHDYQANGTECQRYSVHEKTSSGGYFPDREQINNFSDREIVPAVGGAEGIGGLPFALAGAIVAEKECTADASWPSMW